MQQNVTNKKPNEKLRHWTEWFEGTPVGEFDALREEIITKCKITPTVLRFWRLEYTPVKPQCHETINTIAGEQLDYSFTNKRKFKTEQTASPDAIKS